MDVAVVYGKITRVTDHQVTVDDGQCTTTYKTELPEFEDQQWVEMYIGQRVELKVIDEQIIDVEVGG